MSVYEELLAVQHLRAEVGRGGQSDVWKMSTPAQRKALDIRYKHLVLSVLEAVEQDVKYYEANSLHRKL